MTSAPPRAPGLLILSRFQGTWSPVPGSTVLSTQDIALGHMSDAHGNWMLAVDRLPGIPGIHLVAQAVYLPGPLTTLTTSGRLQFVIR